MGKLDEAEFEKVIARCPGCEATAFEVLSYIDRQTKVMLGERNDDGRWTHDGEKFIDGVYLVTCIRCRKDVFASTDCPRCHGEHGLAAALENPSRLAVPKRCVTCRGTELTVDGFAPSKVRTGQGQRPSPTPIALFGDVGFHVAHVMCEGCDWVALAEGCPLCGATGPLRARPG